MHVAPLEPADWALLGPLYAQAFGGLCPVAAFALANGFAAWCWERREAASAAAQGWVLWQGDTAVGFMSAHLDAEGNATVTAPALLDPGAVGLDLLLDAARDWLRAQNKWRAEFTGLHRSLQVAFGHDLFLQLLNQGCWCYPEGALGVVMALDVTQYATRPAVLATRARLEAEDLRFEWLTPPWVEAAGALMWARFQRRGLAQPLPDGSGRLPYVICRHDEQVLAFCGPVQLEPFGFCDWSFPFVVQEQRGRGIGSVIVALATEWLQGMGGERQVIVTDTGNRAQRLYRQAGFRYCYVAAHDLYLGV